MKLIGKWQRILHEPFYVQVKTRVLVDGNYVVHRLCASSLGDNPCRISVTSKIQDNDFPLTMYEDKKSEWTFDTEFQIQLSKRATPVQDAKRVVHGGEKCIRGVTHKIVATPTFLLSRFDEPSKRSPVDINFPCWSIDGF